MKSYDPPAVVGLRDILWIGAAVAILILVLFVVPQAHAQGEESLTLPLPPHIQKQCEAAGGCVLIPRDRLNAEVERVKQEALMQGYLAGAADSADKGCRRAL